MLHTVRGPLLDLDHQARGAVGKARAWAPRPATRLTPRSPVMRTMPGTGCGPLLDLDHQARCQARCGIWKAMAGAVLPVRTKPSKVRPPRRLAAAIMFGTVRGDDPPLSRPRTSRAGGRSCRPECSPHPSRIARACRAGGRAGGSRARRSRESVSAGRAPQWYRRRSPRRRRPRGSTSRMSAMSVGHYPRRDLAGDDRAPRDRTLVKGLAGPFG